MGGSKVSIRSKDVDIMGISNITYRHLSSQKPPGPKPGTSIMQFLIKPSTQPSGYTGKKPSIPCIPTTLAVIFHGCMMYHTNAFTVIDH